MVFLINNSITCNVTLIMQESKQSIINNIITMVFLINNSISCNVILTYYARIKTINNKQYHNNALFNK